MSTGIFNFNLQANASTLVTSNSWTISSNISPRFNSYPEMNQLLSQFTPSLPADAVKSPSSNVLYIANTSGVFQFFYQSNNIIGSVNPNSSHFKLSLPINDIKGIDITSDGSKIFVLDSYGLISKANLTSSWNVATAVGAVVGNTWMKSKQAGQLHSDYYMREDGRKLYIFNNNGVIEQYGLSNNSFKSAQVEHISSSFGSGFGYGCFNDSGDRLFYLRGGLSNITWIAQYNLSEAWNINSASFSSDFAPINSEGALYDGSCIRASSDGLNLFYTAKSLPFGNRYLYRLPLANSYNLASRVGSYDQQYSTGTRMFEFSTDGGTLYTIGSGLTRNYLGSAWSISSVSSDYTYDISTRGPVGTGGLSIYNSGSGIILGSNTSNTVHRGVIFGNSLDFSDKDTDFYDLKPYVPINSSTFMRVGADSSNIVVYSDRIFYNYRMTSNADLSTTAFAGASNFLASNLTTSANHFTVDSTGTSIYQGAVVNGNGIVYRHTMSNPWNVASLVPNVQSKIITVSSTTGIRVLLSNPQSKFTVIDEDLRAVNFTQTIANNIATANYVSNGTGFFSSTITELNPGYGLKFSNDGLFFFTNQNNTVYIHRLSRPWDISSVISVGTRAISLGISTFGGFSISRPGRYLYYISQSSATIDYGQLKRPRDYINDSFLPITGNTGFNFDLGMYDIEFSNNGTVLLTSSVNGIKRFDNAATPWIPNGGSLPTTLIAGTGQAMPFAVSRNGKFIYVPYNTGDNLYVRRYTLTSPWLGPATLTQEILIPSAKNWLVYGITLDISGNILYLLDARSKTIFSYDMRG